MRTLVAISRFTIALTCGSEGLMFYDISIAMNIQCDAARPRLRHLGRNRVIIAGARVEGQSHGKADAAGKHEQTPDAFHGLPPKLIALPLPWTFAAMP